MKHMRVVVTRYSERGGASLSIVTVNGKTECFFLEPGHYKPGSKVKGITRVAAGVYKLGLRTVGGFHQRYTKKFPDFHQGMLHVQGVYNFQWILIHVGNYLRNTRGCSLTGTAPMADGHRNAVSSSTTAYKKFYKRVIEHVKAGMCTIQYIDGDRL